MPQVQNCRFQTSVPGSPGFSQGQAQPRTLEILVWPAARKRCIFNTIPFVNSTIPALAAVRALSASPGAGLPGLPARLSRGRHGEV